MQNPRLQNFVHGSPDAFQIDIEPSTTGARSWMWLPTKAITVAILVTVGMLVAPVDADGMTLRPETVAAWDEYLGEVNRAHQNRIIPDGSFLWALENADRASKVRGGEIVTAPAPGPNPRKVPGGLIHHWVGAAFVFGARIDDILAVTRDYDKFKEIYRPTVIESQLISRDGERDHFSMRLMNQALFLKFAVDADYRANTVRIGEGRSYSVTQAVRVEEIEKYQQPDEHRNPEGQGLGYIWKLYGISRLEERDGGVYIELEALVLSRDIPAGLRFIVEPIVRRVSRSSLLTSLQETVDAVRKRSSTAPSMTSIRPRDEGSRRPTTGKHSTFSAGAPR